MNQIAVKTVAPQTINPARCFDLTVEAERFMADVVRRFHRGRRYRPVAFYRRAQASGPATFIEVARVEKPTRIAPERWLVITWVSAQPGIYFCSCATRREAFSVAMI